MCTGQGGRGSTRQPLPSRSPPQPKRFQGSSARHPTGRPMPAAPSPRTTEWARVAATADSQDRAGHLDTWTARWASTGVSHRSRVRPRSAANSGLPESGHPAHEGLTAPGVHSILTLHEAPDSEAASPGSGPPPAGSPWRVSLDLGPAVWTACPLLRGPSRSPK